MDRLHDPAVLALPHPVRVDAALGVPIEASMLGGEAMSRVVSALLRQRRLFAAFLHHSSGDRPKLLDPFGRYDHRHASESCMVDALTPARLANSGRSLAAGRAFSHRYP
jgi:hypothetical protein